VEDEIKDTSGYIFIHAQKILQYIDIDSL